MPHQSPTTIEPMEDAMQRISETMAARKISVYEAAIELGIPSEELRRWAVDLANDPHGVAQIVARGGLLATTALLSQRPPDASLGRLLGIQARNMEADPTPQQTTALLAWESLRQGNHQLYLKLRDSLVGLSGTRFVPLATTEGADPRLLRVIQLGSSVDSIHVGKRGTATTLATRDHAGNIELWDMWAGVRISHLRRDFRERVAFGRMSDGRILFSALNSDGSVKMWDPETNEAAGPAIPFDERVTTCVFGSLPDRREVLATGSDRGSISIVDISTAATVTAPTASGRPLGFGFSDGRAILAIERPDGDIGVVNAATGRPVRRSLTGLCGPRFSVAFGSLPDGRTILAAASQNGVRLWDLSAMTDPGRTLTSSHVCAIAFHVLQNGTTMLATAGWDRTVRLWDPESGGELSAPLTGHSCLVDSLAFGSLPAGQPFVATGSFDGTVRIWNPAATGPDPRAVTGLGLVDIQAFERMTGQSPGWVMSVALGALANGSPVLVTGSMDNTIRIWDPLKAEPLAAPWTGHHEPPVFVALGTDSDGKAVLATGSDEGELHVRHLPTGEYLGGYSFKHLRGVYPKGLVTSPDGKIALATESSGGTVRLWDPRTGEPVSRPLSGHDGRVRSVAFGVLPNGRTVLAIGSSYGSIRIWDAQTWEPHGAPLVGDRGSADYVYFAALPTGAAILVTSGYDSVSLWDLAASTPIAQMPWGHHGVGRAVAAGAVMDLSRGSGIDDTGVELPWQPGQASEVGAIAYMVTFDGRLLMACASGNAWSSFQVLNDR